ncbi:MAG: hypothetical protein L0287_35240, partial [Anaerolineae bacterium]|nr:hypothetical protein [Anaerolineae bacterium]
MVCYVVASRRSERSEGGVAISLHSWTPRGFVGISMLSHLNPPRNDMITLAPSRMMGKIDLIASQVCRTLGKSQLICP